MINKSHFVLILLLFCNYTVSGQHLTADGEVAIFSFQTKKGKTVSLSKNKDDEYIVYRYGTPDKIELEFPGKNKESWKMFQFNAASKHGGKENAGMEICNVAFENKNFRYIIFTSRYADDDSPKAGLYVINLKTNKKTKIKGRSDSLEGYLCDFKYNNLLEFENFDLHD